MTDTDRERVEVVAKLLTKKHSPGGTLHQDLNGDIEWRPHGACKNAADTLLALIAKCEALEDKLSVASDMAERLKMEAMTHAQEARTQRSIVHECLQAATGSAGEPGDWHGAEPVKARIEALEAKLAEAQTSDISALRNSGFAPGSYHCFCSECGKAHTADKRAWRCLECAEKRVAQAQPITVQQAARRLLDHYLNLEEDDIFEMAQDEYDSPISDGPSVFLQTLTAIAEANGREGGE